MNKERFGGAFEVIESWEYVNLFLVPDTDRCYDDNRSYGVWIDRDYVQEHAK